MKFAMVTYDLRDGSTKHHEAAREAVRALGLADNWPGDGIQHLCPRNTFVGFVEDAQDKETVINAVREAVTEREGEVTSIYCVVCPEDAADAGGF